MRAYRPYLSLPATALGVGAMNRFRAALSVEAPEWHRQAACAETDPEAFYPQRGERLEVAAAKRICTGCPVRDECLTHALERVEAHGIWGGMTARQRQAERRRSQEES